MQFPKPYCFKSISGSTGIIVLEHMPSRDTRKLFRNLVGNSPVGISRIPRFPKLCDPPPGTETPRGP